MTVYCIFEPKPIKPFVNILLPGKNGQEPANFEGIEPNAVNLLEMKSISRVLRAKFSFLPIAESRAGLTLIAGGQRGKRTTTELMEAPQAMNAKTADETDPPSANVAWVYSPSVSGSFRRRRRSK